MQDYQHRTVTGPAAHTAPAGVAPQAAPTVRACVSERVSRYLEGLDGQEGSGRLYRMMMEEVEQPMLREVLAHTRDNCCQAARILGLNRGTLLARLERYGLDQEIHGRKHKKLRGSEGLVSLQRFSSGTRRELRHAGSSNEHRF